MDIGELTTYQLICDLACELTGENSIGTYQRSDLSKSFSEKEIIKELIRNTGENFGVKIIEWAEWYMKYSDQLSSIEETNLLAVIVSGRILDIKNKRQNQGHP